MTATSDTFLVKDGQTLVFIGDSITDCGRRDQAFPFGSGYVRFAIDLITARYPDRDITYHNRGIGGDVSTGLLRRWDDDVLVHEPDCVSVMIGINETIAAQNPMGAGFLPKTHGGVPHVHECFETSADQYLK